jgi:predicted glycosyltransferase
VSARVFFYVQHLLGIGHLRRAATLARDLSAGGFDVLLVSGGAPVEGLAEGLAQGGARFHQLPAVRAADESLRELARLDGGPFDEAFRRERLAILLKLVRAEAPDIVLTEQFPFGRTRLRFELLPLLKACEARGPLIACSVRDVVRRARPERVAETVQILERWFDAVLIHADPALVPFEQSFADWGRIEAHAFYTGYVSERDLAQRTRRTDGKDEVVVSVGGGATGAPLLEAAVAARPRTALAGRTWRLLVGPDLPNAARAALAAGPGLIIEPTRPDFTTLLGNAVLSISQAGYNTTIEALRCADRAVLVPFGTERETEQSDRAQLLAARGMVAMVPPGTLSPQSLADAVARALAGPSLKSFAPCDTNGGPATAALLHRLLAERRRRAAS